MIEIHSRPQGRKIKKFLQIALLVQPPFLLYASVVDEQVVRFLVEFQTTEKNY